MSNNGYGYRQKKPHRLPLTSMTYNRFDPVNVSEGKRDHGQGKDTRVGTGLVAKERPFVNSRIVNMLSAIGGRANRVRKEMRRTAGQRGS